jgi:hypothetical protein
MLSSDDLAKIREEREAMETWRVYSRHVVAEMLEGCVVCGVLREKENLTRCRWCEDAYYCRKGVCSHQHQAESHPGLAFWTW